MKVITITDENIKSVYGRLKKFFYNNNATGFEGWHSFDCGFKRVKPEILIDNEKSRTVRKYAAPYNIEYCPKGSVPGISYSFIRIVLSAAEVDSIQCGDKIAFCGNRIVYREKWYSFSKENYVYSVFQVLPMKKAEQNRYRTYAEEEANMYEEAEARMFLDNLSTTFY